MHVGVYLPDSTSLNDLLTLYNTADGLGFQSVWKGEQVGSDVLSTLTTLIGRTKRAHLASGILNIFLRNPLSLAMSVVTMDQTSGGRVIVGLGTGSPKRLQTAFGEIYGKPLQTMKEYVQVLRKAVSGETLSHQGRWQIDSFKLGLAPLRKQVPIYVAARHPKMIELAAEVGDGVLTNMISADYAKQVVAPSVKMGAEKANKQPSDLQIASYIITCIHSDEREARKSARNAIINYSMLPHIFSMYRRTPHQAAMEKVWALWQNGRKGEAREAIPDEALDDFALAGKPSMLEAGLERYRRAGITQPILYLHPPEGLGIGALEASLRAAAQELGL